MNAKGSPEAIAALADKASIPEDFDAILSEYTREGLRVLALASRSLGRVGVLNVQVMSQEELEAGLQFVGFAIMDNQLRPDSAEVIRQVCRKKSMASFFQGQARSLVRVGLFSMPVRE